MRTLKVLLILLVSALPVTAFGGVDANDLPAMSTWYLHVDFEEMRTSEAGKGLFDWLDEEIFEEIRDETGIDLAAAADQLTAYSAEHNGLVLVISGRLSRDTQDKALAAAAGAQLLEPMESGGGRYYHIVGDGNVGTENVEIEDLDDEAYFSFDVDDKFLLTSGKEQMEALLANRGRVTGERGHDGALFVLTAERSLIQAGMNTDEMGGDSNGFESNILRNTKQVALMIADVAGNIAIEAQLVADEPEMAQSLASIVRGLIALQAFSEDMDPEVSEFLRNTRVDVDENLLKISVAVSPAAIAAALDEA